MRNAATVSDRAEHGKECCACDRVQGSAQGCGACCSKDIFILPLVALSAMGCFALSCEWLVRKRGGDEAARRANGKLTFFFSTKNFKQGRGIVDR